MYIFYQYKQSPAISLESKINTVRMICTIDSAYNNDDSITFVVLIALV